MVLLITAGVEVGVGLLMVSTDIVLEVALLLLHDSGSTSSTVAVLRYCKSGEREWSPDTPCVLHSYYKRVIFTGWPPQSDILWYSSCWGFGPPLNSLRRWYVDSPFFLCSFVCGRGHCFFCGVCLEWSSSCLKVFCLTRFPLLWSFGQMDRFW